MSRLYRRTRISLPVYSLLVALPALDTARAQTVMVPAGNNSALSSAVKNATPGETIILEGGTYTTGISTSVAGTASQPITIEGENGATLSNTTGTGEGIEVNNNYYIFQNIAISGFQESFRTDAASFGIANNITATGSKIEAFKFKNTSQHWLVENCSVSNSGMEGYYVGDASQNWTGGVPDQSGYVTFYHDTNFVNVNDGFDCKEGTSNVRIIDCESNWNNTVPGANDEGDSGAYVRNDDETIVDYTILNNQSQGNAVRAETATVNGITYGSTCTIYGVVANNIAGSYLNTTQVGTTLYTNYSLTNVAGGLLESGSKTPAEPNPSTFVLPTWSGIDGGFLPINMVWDNAYSAVGNGTTWDFNQQNFNDPGVNGNIPVIFFQGVGVTFNDSNNGNYNVTLGTTVNPASVTVNNSAGNYVFSGSGGITGTGSLTKSGSSTLTLSTANTYTGPTTVAAGVLGVTNLNAFGTTPGTNGTSTVTVASGAAISLATNSQSVLSYTGTINLAGAGINGSGAMIFSARSVLDSSSGSTFVTTNITGGTTIAVNSGSLAVANSIGPIEGSGGLSFISSGSGVLTLNAISSSAPDNTYTGPTTVGSGVTLILHNTVNGSVAIPGNLTINPGGVVGYAASYNITDSSLITDNGTLDLNIRGAATGFTAGSLSDTIGALTGTGSVVTTGTPSSGSDSATLTLSLNDASSHTFNGNITELPGNPISLTKTGNFTQVLDGVDSFTGPTTVSGGLLLIGATGALADSPVNVNGGKLQLATSTGLAQITSVSISSGGTFDVNNNHVIVNYGSGPDPIASIAALLKTGYNAAAWNGAGGIISTAAATNSASYGLGYADSADPGNPAALSSGTIEIAYTLLGDANLSGVVDGTDFGIVAANFNKGVTGWDQGDFNYDNVVDGADFGDLAANFNRGAAGASAVASLDAFAAANGLLADVPEPAMGTLLFAAIGVMQVRRRRRPAHISAEL